LEDQQQIDHTMTKQTCFYFHDNVPISLHGLQPP